MKKRRIGGIKFYIDFTIFASMNDDKTLRDL